MEDRKNYYDLEHLSAKFGISKVKKRGMRLSVMLLAMALVLAMTNLVVDVALAQLPDVIGGGSDVITGVTGTTPESEGVIQSRSDSRTNVEGTLAGYWGEAGEFAGWFLIIFALVFGVAFGLSLLRSIGGIPGALAGFVGGALLAWSVWGIWDQMTKGHIIPFVIVLVLAAIALGGESGADLGIAAVIIIYFSIILDPLVTQSGIWDLMNVLRLFGADSFADLFGLE